MKKIFTVLMVTTLLLTGCSDSTVETLLENHYKSAINGDCEGITTDLAEWYVDMISTIDHEGSLDDFYCFGLTLGNTIEGIEIIKVEDKVHKEAGKYKTIYYYTYFKDGTKAKYQRNVLKYDGVWKLEKPSGEKIE